MTAVLGLISRLFGAGDAKSADAAFKQIEQATPEIIKEFLNIARAIVKK